VLIQSATGPGAEGASGLFSGGIFTVTQRPGSTVTVLDARQQLQGAAVPAPVMARLAAVEAKKKKKKPEEVQEGRQPGVRQRPRPVLDERALRHGRRPGNALAAPPTAATAR
jgi:hypothetical protein